MNNVWCERCRKIVKSETYKCPVCKKKGKVLGRAIVTMVSNGEFKSH